ncbi:hypothetical protein FWH58_00635 [Candidatus Saccharibacteria bacterium]|nr:hypothetical protein [Candidatus Saccharibacteria bacterium]
MNERFGFNPESGLYEPVHVTAITWEDGQTDFIEQMLSESKTAARKDNAVKLARETDRLPISTEAIDQFLGEKLDGVNKILMALAEKKLGHGNPGVVFHVGEAALPLAARLGVLGDAGLLLNGAEDQEEWFNQWLPPDRRNQLPTGAYLLLSRGLMMFGQSCATMQGNINETGAKIGNAIAGKTAQLLGIVPSLDYYGQSKYARTDMTGKVQYTPETTARGSVAGLVGWLSSVQADIRQWDGVGRPGFGGRGAVM